MIAEELVLTRIKEMDDLRSDISETLEKQVRANAELRSSKLDLDTAKAAYDEAVASATAEAMFGKQLIDGKNAEARKAQLDAYLLQCETVTAARERVEAEEYVLADSEANADMAQAEVRALMTKIGLSQHAAALLTAWYTLLANCGSKVEEKDLGW